MQNFYCALSTFLAEPNEINYQSYIDMTLSDIASISDMLIYYQDCDAPLEHTSRHAAWMIQKATSDMRKIMDLWTDTKRYNVLEEAGHLMLMAEDNDKEEVLYAKKEQNNQIGTEWFVLTGHFAKRITEDEAKEWYEQNNLKDVSPFHKVA